MIENSIDNNSLQFLGKIAVITGDSLTTVEDYNSVEHLTAKYGADKILHRIRPTKSVADHAQIQKILTELADDKEIKALILNQALPGSNAAADSLKKIREDIFIVLCSSHESASDTAAKADLVLGVDELNAGAEMVMQANKQGAKVFIHYSFPRHMAIPLVSRRYDLIKDTCETLDIQFVGLTAPDPAEEAGITAVEDFLSEDVSRLVAKYGCDTAIFNTNCASQIPLIKAVINNHAIYPQPCCPSPLHGFPEALGIDRDKCRSDLHYLICEASRIAEEKNMTDRLSTWPVSASMMFTNAGVEYAIKWINGQVSKTGIDDEALKKCMNIFIENAIGEEGCVFMKSYSEGETTYYNYKQILMSYLDF